MVGMEEIFLSPRKYLHGLPAKGWRAFLSPLKMNMRFMR
jgi:hypothetical protein